jgi:signal transduction histidine kinase
MLNICSVEYRFTREAELQYIEWMFPQNKKLISYAVLIIIAFIVLITGADFFSGDRTFEFFSVITLLRVSIICLALVILYAFSQKNALKAQNILFVDILLVVILYTVDNYISFRDINNILSPAVQMFSLYLFMLIPFLSFLHKLIIGGAFIGGLAVCILNLELANSTETMGFVVLTFIVEILVSYRLDLLFRAKFKAFLEDKKHAAELRESKQELEEALASEREVIKQNLNFIDMISHEYRTPLSIITTSIDSIETLPVVSDSERLKQYVQTIRNASRRLLSIYESSLHEKRINLSGVMPYKKTVELLSIVEMAVEFTRSIYPAHQIFIDDNIRPGAAVVADSELLTTAIINIIDNACKYSHPSRVDVALLQEGSAYIVRIIDAGFGIDGSDIDAVFEKYFRSGMTKQKPGAGVGLYLVKKIIELHNGSIEITSRRNVGTTVMFSIPFSKEEHE